MEGFENVKPPFGVGGAIAFTAFARARFAFAKDASAPIIFVHGDSDQGCELADTVWRFESNGYPRDRLFVINFADPQSRDDNDVPQPGRSSAEDELRQLSAFVDEVRARTGADKVALVASSRGGFAVRNYIASAELLTLATPCSAVRKITGS